MKDIKLVQDDFQPLRNVVFNTLRDAILRGDLQPGERLMEIHLAKKLGVSRTPVREAISMLEQEGLAVTYPRRGAQVAKMTVKDLDDVLEIREVLDTLAASLACCNMNSDDINNLAAACADFEKATRGNDIREVVRTDEAFHNVIYEASGNPRLRAILLNLKGQMYRFRFEYVKDKSNYPFLIKEHKDILEALKTRNEEEVIKHTKKHLVNQMESVRQVILSQE